MCDVEITRANGNRFSVRLGCVSIIVYVDEITRKGVTKPVVVKSDLCKGVWIEPDAWNTAVDIVLAEYWQQRGVE